MVVHTSHRFGGLIALASRSSRRSCLLMLVVMTLTASHAFGDAPPEADAEAVLKAYELSVQKYWENVEFKCSATFTKIILEQTIRLSEEGVCCVSTSTYHDKKTPVKKAYSVGSGDRFVRIRGSDEHGTNTESWSISANLKLRGDARLRNVAIFGVRELLGLLSGSTEEEVTTLSDRLREADRLTASPTTVDGIEMIALAGESSRFTLEVVLIPSKGYVLHRLVYTNLNPKPGQNRKYSSEFSDYLQTGGLWIPRVGTRTIHYVPPTASPVSALDTSFDRIITTEFQVGPLRQLDEGHVAGFIEDVLGQIQDGTQVRMQDARHLDFVWRDGKPLPVTEEAVEAWVDATLQPSRPQPAPFSKKD